MNDVTTDDEEEDLEDAPLMALRKEYRSCNSINDNNKNNNKNDDGDDEDEEADGDENRSKTDNNKNDNNNNDNRRDVDDDSVDTDKIDDRQRDVPRENVSANRVQAGREPNSDNRSQSKESFYSENIPSDYDTNKLRRSFSADSDKGKEQGIDESEGVIARLTAMEKRIKREEEVGVELREEVRMLRDRVEEDEWANNQLKAKVDSLEEEVTVLKRKLGEEKSLREDECRKRVMEVEDRISQKVKDLEVNGGGESQPRNVGGVSQMRNGGGVSQTRDGGGDRQQRNDGVEGHVGDGGRGGERRQARAKQRCVILTDSNGRGATSDSIKNHIPRGEREYYDIEVTVAYTVEEAFHRVARRNIDVRDAVVVVDNLTNNVRGTSTRKAASPQELVNCVDQLGGKLREAGAKAVVLCQLKPMQLTNVTPYNELLDNYLRNLGSGGYGCRTQIRLEYLKTDGYHILPQYDSIIDRTYACALMGIPVPYPTPFNEFVPYHVRQRWEREWPRIGVEGRTINHGWRW